MIPTQLESTSVLKLLNKIAAIQANIGKLSKDTENDFFKSKYFDINKLVDTLQPFLVASKLILTQPTINGSVYSIITDLETGESIESVLSLPPNETNPQKIGSCITYYRRYTLQSLLALQSEDDDGNKAAAKPKPKPKVIALSDDNIKASIEKGTQKRVLADIKKSIYSATNSQILELTK